MDREAWQAAVLRVAQSRTRLKQLGMHSFPCRVHKSILYVGVSFAALQIGSSVPFF